MTVSVLVVDDSSFFRRRLGDMIASCPGLSLIGTATNGQEAIDKTLALKPDVITMDYEMPIMDGITAVRLIMEQCPTPILMFSSLTYEGARVTLDSLEAGAVDFLPKNFSEISSNSKLLKQKLSERIHQVAASGMRRGRAPQEAKQKPPPVKKVDKANQKDYSLVAIGTSTGGPVALQKVLSQLPANFSAPLVLVQHMPSTFTAAFAERLNSLCQITVKEAVDGECLKPGVALLAPGGKQLMIIRGDKVKVLPGDDRLTYKPSVDVTFGSAANVYADKVLGVILTGMGSDGCEGAKMLKAKGSTIWAQDEASSVIYGMPLAVAKANLTDEILSIDNVGLRLSEAI